MVAKHQADFERAILANANRGGENVHSGMFIGAALGAANGASNIPQALKDGLRDSVKIQEEIDAFVNIVAPAKL